MLTISKKRALRSHPYRSSIHTLAFYPPPPRHILPRARDHQPLCSFLSFSLSHAPRSRRMRTSDGSDDHTHRHASAPTFSGRSVSDARTPLSPLSLSRARACGSRPPDHRQMFHYIYTRRISPSRSLSNDLAQGCTKRARAPHFSKWCVVRVTAVSASVRERGSAGASGACVSFGVTE